MKNGKVLFPIVFLKIYSIFAMVLIFSFTFMIIDYFYSSNNGIIDLVGIILITLFMIALPFILVTQNIVLQQNGTFKYSFCFFKKTYTSDDVVKVYLEHMLIIGIKRYVRIELIDGKRFGVTDFYWSKKYYEKIEEFFIKNNPDKIVNKRN